MTLQIDFWALLLFLAMLLLTFFGGVWGFAKFTMRQMDQRLDERFSGQKDQVQKVQAQITEMEHARTDGQQRWGDRFAGIDRQLADHRERIAKMEARQSDSPTHNDLAKLHERINDMSETLNTLVGEFRGANKSLDLIQGFLLTGEKP